MDIRLRTYGTPEEQEALLRMECLGGPIKAGCQGLCRVAAVIE